MNQVENAVIKYAIDFEKYKNGQANEIIKLLDKANNEIAGYIKKTNGIATKARYKDITKKLKEISERLKESVGENIDIDGVINYELQKQKKLFGFARPYLKKNNTGKISFVYPTVEQIKTDALFQPIVEEGYGLTFQSFLEGIQTGLFNTWDSALRTGYLTGIPTKQIVSNVLGKSSKVGELVTPGLMKTLKNSVYSNTRTALQSFANETMQRVYKENDRLLGDIYPKDGEVYKYEYLATLDNRTCLVCADSAKLYKELQDIPHIPQHRGCRCVVIPYFNIEGDTRASKDGYVRADITFDEWLRGQDEKTQLDVLGKTRYEMFKSGTTINQFVDNGQVLTLKELEERDLYTPEDNSKKMALSKDSLEYREEHIIDNPLSDKEFNEYKDYFLNEYDIKLNSNLKTLNKDNVEEFLKDFEKSLKNNPQVSKAISTLQAKDDDTMFMQQNGNKFELNQKYFKTDNNFLKEYIEYASKDGKMPKNSTLYSCIEHEITHFYEKVYEKDFAKNIYEKCIREYSDLFEGTKQEFVTHFRSTVQSISTDIFTTHLNYSELLAYCRQDYYANKDNCTSFSKLMYNEFERYINAHRK